jgi:hypothetical protein
MIKSKSFLCGFLGKAAILILEADEPLKKKKTVEKKKVLGQWDRNHLDEVPLSRGLLRFFLRRFLCCCSFVCSRGIVLPSLP